jgi:hypothetical protein
MPVASSLRELIDAIQTGKTNTTRALDELFGSQAALSRVNAHQNRTDLDDVGVFSSGPGGNIPPWAERVLQGQDAGLPVNGYALSQVEIQHVNNWPPANKETLREKLVEALVNLTPLEFRWELYDGADEGIDTTSVPNRITFRSPKSRAELSGPGAAATTIKVKVGR